MPSKATTKSLKYHSRRVLGQLVAAKDGLMLDAEDKKHAIVLLKRGWVWSWEAMGIRVYKATSEGAKAWNDGLKPAV